MEFRVLISKNSLENDISTSRGVRKEDGQENQLDVDFSLIFRE